jgi:hypothetical protein
MSHRLCTNIDYSIAEGALPVVEQRTLTVPGRRPTYYYRMHKVVFGGPACYIDNTEYVDVYTTQRWSSGPATGNTSRSNRKPSRGCTY